MKSNIRLAAVLSLFFAALLLPLGCLAQSKPKIKSVDLTLPVPTPGMSLFDAREFQLTSAKTEYGDLAASGGIRVQLLDWIGDFRETDDGDMFFKDGFVYKVRLQFMVDPAGKYTTDYIFKNNDYYIDGSRISATVNGIKAKVERSAPYFINVEVSLPVGAGGKGSDRDLAQSKPTKYEINKESYRASMKAYSIAEADAVNPDVSPLDVVIVTDSHAPSIYTDANDSDFPKQVCMRLTKIIVDSGDERVCEEMASMISNIVQGPYNIREAWISDKVDAVKFVRTIASRREAYMIPHTDIHVMGCSYLFNSTRATVFLPETAVEGVRAMLGRPTWSYAMPFSLKTYSGDVYSAQKAGADAAKPFCKTHVFTDKVMGADKAVRYVTCGNWEKYYYSCKYCGKCEHDPNHTFTGPRSKYAVLVHKYDMPLANDQAYVGVNAAGQHVWWYSCVWCGHSKGYDQKHMSQAEWRASGNGLPYETFRKQMADMTENYEQDALLKTDEQVGMFILGKKSDAKMNPAYQSSVNFALNDNLLDDDILGKDYTLALNNRQLKSLAERLVAELTGETTQASVIGLDQAVGKTVSDDAPATRQEVAAVMYRALAYIEEIRLYSYTEFTSGLDKYSDSGDIAPWAREAMAFMEALGLMKGISATTIAPDKVCTIEEAIDLTQKCTHAHQLGWYQARSWGEGVGRSYNGGMQDSKYTVAPGERVWVIGPRIGDLAKALPVVDPYTGQIVYVDAEWFRPVRKNVFESKRTIIGPVIFKAQF